MAKFLCSEEGKIDVADAVDQHMYLMAKEARDRGFKKTFLKSILTDIETHTISKEENEVYIRFIAKRRTAINPIYYWVGKIFSLGETYSIDETIRVVHENDKWKVCGSGLTLAGKV
jgi:hypothetical protein